MKEPSDASYKNPAVKSLLLPCLFLFDIVEFGSYLASLVGSHPYSFFHVIKPNNITLGREMSSDDQLVEDCSYCGAVSGNPCERSDGTSRSSLSTWSSIPVWTRPKTIYAVYIISPEWQAKRLEFFDCSLFEGTCAACGTIPDSYNIHHLTYTRLGEEKLEDLVALCGRCHVSLHAFHATTKFTLYSASQKFIQSSRKARSAKPYLFHFHEFKYKKHRSRV